MHGASTLRRHPIAGRLIAISGILLAVMALALVPARAGTAFAGVTGGVNTTFPDGDASHCSAGTQINCNHYDGKQYVYLSGNPSQLSAGQYFYAVLDPGGQPHPNDSENSPKNLSLACDTYPNREFSVDAAGAISQLGPSTHLTTTIHPKQFTNLAIQVGDPTNSCYFRNTDNPGGVYILAVCQISSSPTTTGNAITYSTAVDPNSCKYDAFKVTLTAPQFTAVLSGRKFLDNNGDGVDESGEPGLNGWTINLFKGSTPSGSPIQTTTTNTCADPTQAGCYSFSIDLPAARGSTTTATYTVCEVLQPGWTQTGPQSPQQNNVIGTAGTALTGTLNTGNGACYVVTVPLTSDSAVFNLDFFNRQNAPPSCNLTASATNASGQAYIQVTVQAANGLKSVQVTTLNNSTAAWDNPAANIALNGFAPVTVGDTTAHVVTATKIDQTLSAQLALQVIDTLGNVVNCDPVQTAAIRSAGQPQTQSVAGVQQTDHLMTVFNGSTGVSTLTVTVNGHAFTLRGLTANQRVTIDIASALVAGANTVSLQTTGQPGASASLLFGNIK